MHYNFSRLVNATTCSAILLSPVALAQSSIETLEQQIKSQQQALVELTEALAKLKQTQQSDHKTTDEVKRPSVNSSQQVVQAKPAKSALINQPQKTWQFTSYGSLLIKAEPSFDNVQDTSAERRTRSDLARVVTELEVELATQWQFELELEYEHGGTGTALEFDGFDEFGEFESEVEAGGEVIVEKLQFEYQYNDQTTVKFGRIFVPIGITTELHQPAQYFTTERHWSEAKLIPQVWYEHGINVNYRWQNFKLQGLVTTGLNSEYFRSYNFVANGHQKRFEQINADDLAYTLRFDYGSMKSTGIGLSYYQGSTTNNRHNSNNLSASGKVELLGVHGRYQTDNYRLTAQYLWGKLNDSSAIALANKTTPGLQPGNFAQLGSEASSYFIEAGMRVNHWLGQTSPIWLFASVDHANPLEKVATGITSERFNETQWALGLNISPISGLIIKSQLNQQQYQQANLSNTYGFSLALDYQFSL